MFVSTSTKTSQVKINAIASVILYSGFIVTTLFLSAIALGVDIREAVSSFPLVEETVNAQKYTVGK